MSNLSERRAAIRQVLLESTEPISTQQLISQSGVDQATVASFMSYMVKTGGAHNVGTIRAALYVSGPAPVPKLPLEFRTHSNENYTGSSAVPMRPGAMDAFELPSLQGGKLVERRRPIINGARPEVRA